VHAASPHAPVSPLRLVSPPKGPSMLVRTLDQVTDTDDDIKTENWRAKRTILAKGGEGFPVHECTLYDGSENDIWYANHIEAVFVTHGEGESEDSATGEVHRRAQGSLYPLNDHDTQKVRVRKEIRCVCVFNPPVTGREVHDENGVYPLVTEEV